MLVTLPAINVAVVNQINTTVGLNLAILSPGAVQTLVQQGANGAAVGQFR
jgi:hypothetical protein